MECIGDKKSQVQALVGNSCGYPVGKLIKTWFNGSESSMALSLCRSRPIVTTAQCATSMLRLLPLALPHLWSLSIGTYFHFSCIVPPTPFTYNKMYYPFFVNNKCMHLNTPIKQKNSWQCCSYLQVHALCRWWLWGWGWRCPVESCSKTTLQSLTAQCQRWGEQSWWVGRQGHGLTYWPCPLECSSWALWWWHCSGSTQESSCSLYMWVKRKERRQATQKQGRVKENCWSNVPKTTHERKKKA